MHESEDLQDFRQRNFYCQFEFSLLPADELAKLGAQAASQVSATTSWQSERIVMFLFRDLIWSVALEPIPGLRTRETVAAIRA